MLNLLRRLRKNRPLILTGYWVTGKDLTNRRIGKPLNHGLKKIILNNYGFGYTLQDKDTIWQETIKLVESNSSWSFEVTGKGESEPTVFKLTNIEKEQFSSENPENEFPKLINYYKDGDRLKAMISDGEMEIPFVFQKIQNVNKDKD